ncbi:LSU ribosomal protein L9p [hydrothermal vent metagenome]|uniref:LSU ribosomal protein L9p n=1 Tax=hydrothermal vent metagenome TaxID=652676 RepID=A0A3B0T738_9ZZZZ
MQVILLERIEKLGQMGDIVSVKPGFARNFLLPKRKALRASKANMTHFEGQRAQLEARNLELKGEAGSVADKLGGLSFIVIRQAGEAGQLYGSVSSRDLAETISEGGFSLTRNQVILDRPIKMLGLHEVRVSLHPEVITLVTVNVARSEEEAERQARGEDVTMDRFAEDGPQMVFGEDLDDDEDGEDEDGEDGAEDRAEEAGDSDAEATDREKINQTAEDTTS